MDIKRINTIQELKEAGYKPKSIKEEIRQNLIRKLQAKEDTFRGIIGYEETVIPDVERALLSKHNILFLGLRGQAKTRMARQMT
ncbi:MAG: magnesium chelatase, partial [Flavisolibacter sp.]|nr:magnesium chelatase [Flavisolibacter sp.]